jgi:hypothetical protein
MPRRPPRRTHSAADLRSVAWYQKFLIVCMLGQVLVWVGHIAFYALTLDDRADPVGRPGPVVDPMYLALAATWLLCIFGAIFVVLIGLKVSGPTLGVVLGLLTLIPCVSLIIIVVVNTQATGLLQRNGVRVGLFGARMADLADLSEIPDGDDEDEDDDDDRPRRRRRHGYGEIDEDEGW